MKYRALILALLLCVICGTAFGGQSLSSWEIPSRDVAPLLKLHGSEVNFSATAMYLPRSEHSIWTVYEYVTWDVADEHYGLMRVAQDGPVPPFSRPVYKDDYLWPDWPSIFYWGAK